MDEVDFLEEGGRMRVVLSKIYFFWGGRESTSLKPEGFQGKTEMANPKGGEVNGGFFFSNYPLLKLILS